MTSEYYIMPPLDPAMVTLAPDAILTGQIHHDAGSAAAPSITVTGDTNTGLFFPAADAVGIATGGTEIARFTANRGISKGGAPQAFGAGWYPSIQSVFGGSDAAFGAARYSTASAVAAGMMALGRSRGAGVGNHAAVVTGDAIGTIAFVGSDGASFQAAGEIRAECDATPAQGVSMPGRIVITTTPAGTTTPVERLRVGSDGVLRHGGAAGTVIVDANSSIGLRSYTVATLPSPTAARLVFVSDVSGNRRLAVADGAGWRFPDGAVVS